MGIARQLRQYTTSRLSRRVSRAMPWVGGIIALVTLRSAIRQKGWIRGAADTALDAVPFVGGAKNLAEAVRGRDFIADRRRVG